MAHRHSTEARDFIKQHFSKGQLRTVFRSNYRNMEEENIALMSDTRATTFSSVLFVPVSSGPVSKASTAFLVGGAEECALLPSKATVPSLHFQPESLVDANISLRASVLARTSCLVMYCLTAREELWMFQHSPKRLRRSLLDCFCSRMPHIHDLLRSSSFSPSMPNHSDNKCQDVVLL